MHATKFSREAMPLAMQLSESQVVTYSLHCMVDRQEDQRSKSRSTSRPANSTFYYYYYYYYYYYQFYRLGTGGFHKKAKPVRYATQSQRGPIRNQMGQDTNKF